MDTKKLQFLSQILLLFLLLSFSSLHLPSLAFTPVDNYLINCGSNGNTNVDNRNFIGDESSSGSIFLSATKTISLQDQNPSQDSSSLYYTARIFTRVSSYKFEVKKNGTHIVRLHFFPFKSQGYDLHHASFHVSANEFSILKDFSFQNISTVVLKEYISKVDSEILEIMFTPLGFGFVNAIEVFSAPSDLIPDDDVRIVNSVGFGVYKGLSSQILETIYRLNVGGDKITPFNDTLWRTWNPDEEFLMLKSAAKKVQSIHKLNYPEGGATREIAPDYVYKTAQEMNISMLTPIFNLTWALPLSPRGDAKYLVRMHFCDIVSNAPHQLIFDVYINGNSACKDLDLSTLSSGQLVAPYYMDFFVDTGTSVNMTVSVGKSGLSEPRYVNAILNGLEIMKMVNGGYDLSIKTEKKKNSVGVLVGLVVGGFAILCVVILAFLVALKCKKNKKSKLKPSETVTWSPLPASPCTNINLGLKISFAEIKFATNNFNKNMIIGSGGFGMVYKGVLRDNRKVAVKRGVPGSKQGLPEFQTEITVLSTIRHRHLVSLVGYCKEQSEMILVYELMEKGPLKNHLYGSELPTLTWKQRLEICIGAAKGLHYLHTGSTQGIIHRDVKSTNILLDENYMSKVADFGLSRSGPCLDETHVSTGVKGSFGYLDPEYFKLQKLTDKSDVYSFGVVLFEVVCARPAIDTLLCRDEVNLAEWAMQWQSKGLLEKIIDPKLTGMINPSSLKKFGETAEKCLADYGVDRPTMGDVSWNLKYALQLQEKWVPREAHEDSTNHASDLISPAVVLRIPSINIRMEGDSSDGSSDVTSSQVFSQLIKNEGR